LLIITDSFNYLIKKKSKNNSIFNIFDFLLNHIIIANFNTETSIVTDVVSCYTDCNLIPFSIADFEDNKVHSSYFNTVTANAIAITIADCTNHIDKTVKKKVVNITAVIDHCRHYNFDYSLITSWVVIIGVAMWNCCSPNHLYSWVWIQKTIVVVVAITMNKPATATITTTTTTTTTIITITITTTTTTIVTRDWII
jgi:hypothetical protein